MSHLLSLSALHAAAPGVLDVVFGADGDFDGAPRWTGPVRSPGGWLSVVSVNYPAQVTCIHLGIGGRVDRYMDELALDCRIPSVAARLLRLCSFVQSVDPNAEPDEIAALTLSLAPRIAALRRPA